MKDIKELIKEYREACKYTEKCAEKIGEWIVKVSKPVIEDISYAVGSVEAGIETISFYSKKRNVVEALSFDDIKRNKMVYFVDLVTKVIPEIEGFIETPYGLYLTKKEAEELKKILFEEVKNEPKQEQTKRQKNRKSNS